jgi:hypothetical protein
MFSFEEIVPRFSPRVGALLQSGHAHRHPDKTCTRADLERLLTERRLPVYEPVLRFEEVYGGIFIEGAGTGDDLQLGSFWRLSELAPDSGSAWCEQDGEVMVTIGTVYNELCMGRRGEVCLVGMDDSVIEAGTSFEKYLEEHAMRFWLPRWCSTFLRVDIRPALGDTFAKMLRLNLMAEVSDSLNSWWQGEEYIMAEHRGRNDARRGRSYVWARSLDGLGAAIRMASTLQSIDIGVVARDQRSAVIRGAEKDQIVVPGEPASASAGALRLPYESSDPQFSGFVELREEPGSIRIEQYRYLQGKLVGWDSFSEGDRVSRSIA